MITNKGFTLIELLVTIAIMGILSMTAISALSQFGNSNEKILTAFEDNNKSRFNELYNKSLIGANWYYDNAGIKKPTYAKIYCDDTNKSIKGYICDSTNPIVDSTFKNCIQIDYPDFDSLKIDGKTLNVADEYSIKNCIYREGNGGYINGSYYAKINLNFPYGVKIYGENIANTKDNENDDIELIEVGVSANKENQAINFTIYKTP